MVGDVMSGAPTTEEADPLKGAIALLRFDNPCSETSAYVLCYATEYEARYMGIGQKNSWDRRPEHPRRLRAGLVAGMDQLALDHGEVINPRDFPHELVGLLDLPPHEIKGMEAMGVRSATPEERRL